MSDIKDLLSKAVGDDEPPVGSDGDEGLRVGRQRVRRRRALAAASVVAAVVVAVVGASLVTDLVEVTPDEVPVAEAPPAPPGPDLPLPPSTRAEVPRATTEGHAARLTQKLYSAGLVRLDMVAPWPGRSGSPRFRIENDGYLYEADLDRSGREGTLRVTVTSAPPSRPASCADLDEKHDNCTVVPGYGQPVVQATWNAEGGRRYLAVTVLPDGTKVAAVVTNLPRHEEDDGKHPDGGTTPLDMGELTTLITKSGFGVH